MKMVFWQNMLSHHDSPYILALVEMGHNVTLIADTEVEMVRVATGCDVPELGRTQIILSLSDREIDDFVKKNLDAVHVISGYRGYFCGKRAVKACIKYRARFGLLSERGDTRGIIGLLRRGLYAWGRWTIGRDIDFVIAMGSKGYQWFSSVGYPNTRIFVFGYITPSPNTVAVPPHAGAFRVIFIGQLIHRKGVDLLLKALASIQILPWELVVIGEGEDAIRLQKLATRLGIAERIEWRGKMSNSATMEVLSKTDLLVLPSRFDGWGAVVNEALMMGVPAVCSDACGSADLLGDPWRGSVFIGGSVYSLTKTLETWIKQGKRTLGVSKNISEWSKYISGKTAAKYLVSIFEHVYDSCACPNPPWHRTDKQYGVSE